MNIETTIDFLLKLTIGLSLFAICYYGFNSALESHRQDSYVDKLREEKIGVYLEKINR